MADKMIKAIKLTPNDQGKCTSKDSSSGDTAKDASKVKYDPNLDLQLRDILNKVFSYKGSIILGFPCLSDEQVEKNADQIRKILSSQTTTDTSQGSKVQLVDVQIKKSTCEQLKEAIEKYNSEAEPGDPTCALVKIFTSLEQHVLAVSDNKDPNNRYPVYFKPVPTTDDDHHHVHRHAHYTDLSTTFVTLTDIDPRIGKDVTMFINFIDCTTGLPMGTIQQFGPGDNRLYTYDPLNDPNDPPPTGYYENLCYWTRKVTENDQDFVGRFLFEIGGGLELAHVYPIQNSPDQRISKESDCTDDVVNAVIQVSNLELTIDCN